MRPLPPIATCVACLVIFLACLASAQTSSPGAEAAIAASKWDKAGEAARDQKDYATAISDYQKAIEIDPKYASAWMDLGVAYLDQKQYQQANAVFQKYLTLPGKPDEQLALLLLGSTYQLLKQYPQAADTYRALLRLTHERGLTFKAHYELGHSLCMSGQYAAAIDELQQAMQLEVQACDAEGACADSEDVRSFLGLSYYRLQRYPEALQAFKEAARLKPEDSSNSYLLGMTYVRMGEKQNALDEYQKLLAVDKADADDLYNEINKMSGAAQAQPSPAPKPAAQPPASATGNGAALAAQCKQKADAGDYANATEICKNALAANPGDAEAWSNFGTALFATKRHTEAIQAFQQVLRMKPNDAHALYGVGAAYVETRDYDKAIPYLRQAVRLDENNASVWYDLGHSFYEVKQYPNAEQALEQADRLQPDDNSTEYWLGRTYVRMGKKTQALAAYQKLTATDAGKKMAPQLYTEINQMDAAPGAQPSQVVAPVSGTTDSSEANAYSDRCRKDFDAKNYGGALEACKKAIDLNSKLQTAYVNLGATYFEMHQMDQAIPPLKESTRLDPKDAGAWGWLGLTYYAAMKLPEAIQALQESIRLDPNNVLTYETLGNAYYVMGSKDQALAVYRKLQTMDKDAAQEMYSFMKQVDETKSQQKRPAN